MTDPWEEQERHEMQAEWEDAIMAENTKLRELLKDSVSLLDETCDTYYESDYHAIVDRARELGVEVTS